MRTGPNKIDFVCKDANVVLVVLAEPTYIESLLQDNLHHRAKKQYHGEKK